ncbi:MAG TPA: hypothetical protein VG347_15900 [Verrucomicrobiae bacterium]|nr:hypothetical protein [Verrucomicrobiae bacterium]
MKFFLFFAGLITLLTSTGCIVADDRRYHHERYERHEEVRPEVIIGPPEVIVR